MLRHSCWCSGTPAGATALLLREQARPDRCSGTLAGATTLLLREQARPDRCSGTPTGATALLLREQARPDRCSSTPAGATALLLREQARPDRCSGIPAGARHSCCVGRHVLNGALALLLVLRHSCSILYLRVLIVLCPTHSVLLV